MSQSDYLEAMGISTWVLKDGEKEALTALNDPNSLESSEKIAATVEEKNDVSIESGVWTFVIDHLDGDSSLLFDKILASLMLKRTQIQLINSQEALSGKASGQIVIAMGTNLGKKLLQLTEPFDELRGAIQSLEIGGQELPLVLTYHPEDLLKHPMHKSKTWQDLILARSLI
jgi:DNA polymerase III psi subunit